MEPEDENEVIFKGGYQPRTTYISADDQSDTSIEYLHTEEKKPVINANLLTEVNYGHHGSKIPKQHDIKEQQTENIEATYPIPQPTRITWPFQGSECEDVKKLEQLLQHLEEPRLNVLRQLRNVYEKKGISANRIKQFGKLVDWSESETESEDDKS
ncbi:uncharacterized protein ACHE_10927A [Aspergillus chevalieri]|uniref:Uncharacterized protein n=1 Tax=Aspergillus chevalieri TaxID=182096 RepID=A0A7R7ZIC9_ASPCH|nr:uncharacterized protein ACHE_10927A [Aspergillus chevalieri]BCR83525.1 hypothetical protein ACHE_10927A [Aspergillus chevalieri]